MPGNADYENQPPRPITKQVPAKIKGIYNVANMTWKVLRMTKQIEFSVVTRDNITGQPKSTMTHTVSLTNSEMDHLDNGGKIIAAHVCGWQPHIQI